MARLMAESLHGEPITVLVATSGDTGSAVADGFAGRPGVRVVLLYPKGQVSPVQERQLIVARPGVQALAVEGTFDDCQRLVKAAFAEPGLGRLSSANSINIGRLLPQMLYYTWAVRQLGGMGDAGWRDGQSAPPEAEVQTSPTRSPLPSGEGQGEGPSSPEASGARGRSGARDGGPPPSSPTVVVPSGNLGNLTAGMLAQAAGLPVRRFVAAHNANAGFARFLGGAAPEAVAVGPHALQRDGRGRAEQPRTPALAARRRRPPRPRLWRRGVGRRHAPHHARGVRRDGLRRRPAHGGRAGGRAPHARGRRARRRALDGAPRQVSRGRPPRPRRRARGARAARLAVGRADARGRPSRPRWRRCGPSCPARDGLWRQRPRATVPRARRVILGGCGADLLPLAPEAPPPPSPSRSPSLSPNTAPPGPRRR